MNFRKLIFSLQPYDVIVVVFGLFLITINLVYMDVIKQWLILLTVNIVVIIFVFVTAFFSNNSSHKVLKILHNWYIAPMILITFKQLYFIIKPIHEKDYDQLLIDIDRFLFGVDPTVWLAKFSHPVITEILQISYSSFYFLFIIMGIELYRREGFKQFRYAAFLIIYGFYLSYLGYFALPAIGPRFTLHSFELINTELPGLFATNFLRDFVNLGESIIKGHPDPAAIVQRDVFPSGHTQLTLLLMFIAYKYQMRVRVFIWVIGSFLIMGTVYLRYHYVIDLIAGAIFMVFTIWSAKYIYYKWLELQTAKLTKNRN